MSFGTLLGKSKLGSIDEENALLEPIKKDINNIGAVLRYADYLQRKGDPYGEFIAIHVAYQSNKQGGKILTRLKQLFVKESRFNPDNQFDKKVMKDLADKTFKESIAHSSGIYSIKNGFITGIRHFDIGEWLEYGYLLLQGNPLLTNIDFTTNMELDESEEKIGENQVRIYNYEGAELHEQLSLLNFRVRELKVKDVFPKNCQFLAAEGYFTNEETDFLNQLFNNKVTSSISHLDISSFPFDNFQPTSSHPLRSLLVQDYISSLDLGTSYATDNDFMLLAGLVIGEPEIRTSSEKLEILNLYLASISYLSLEQFYENKEFLPSLKELHVASDRLFDYKSGLEGQYNEELELEIRERWASEGTTLNKIIERIKVARPNLKVIIHND